jgi:hypothetical protein
MDLLKNLDNMITVEECFNNFVDFEICPLKEYTPKVLINDTKLAMIKFAKLHVETALKKASENIKNIYDNNLQEDVYINENDIINAYPLENIK